MKKGTFITLISAILLLMAVNSVYAQEANGFKKFDVKEDFTENGFRWFRDAEIMGHQSEKVFENYVRIGLSEQAQMVGDKKAVSTSFLLAAKKAKNNKVLA